MPHPVADPSAVMSTDPHMPSSPPVSVDCHRIDLDLPRPAASDAWLSEQERTRAARFRFPHLQQRYRATRVALRSLLGLRLGIEPAAVRFVRDARGKPRLDPAHGSPLHFNLSHSEGVAWIAIAEQPLGVDLEILDRRIDLLDSLGLRVSAPAERAILQALPPELQLPGFLLMWTRKEAVLKGWGLGIAGISALGSLDTCLPGLQQIEEFFSSRQVPSLDDDQSPGDDQSLGHDPSADIGLFPDDDQPSDSGLRPDDDQPAGTVKHPRGPSAASSACAFAPPPACPSQTTFTPPRELARLPQTLVSPPGTAEADSWPPLHVSSHHLDGEILAITAATPFQPTLHLWPPAPFTLPVAADDAPR